MKQALALCCVFLVACGGDLVGGMPGDDAAGGDTIVPGSETAPATDGGTPGSDQQVPPAGDGPPGTADGQPPAPDQGTPQPDSTTPPAPTSCAPLPAPSGNVINVTPSQAAQLPQIVANAAAGSTIALADGTYKMTGGEAQRRIQIQNNGITVRSASGKRDAVIIDGEYQTNEIIVITGDDVTIADLTIKRAVDHLIHVTGGNDNTLRTKLWNLHLEDSGEQFVKVNPSGSNTYVDDGSLECSRFVLTSAGRPNIEPNPGGCYTGGIDAHAARGWVVRKNHFEGIYCTNGGLAEHAVHFWSTSRDTLVEQNVIVDCARGVGFGLRESGTPRRTYADNPYPGVGYLDHIDGIIRNNLIYASGAAASYFDTGIELDQARGAAVHHNTVASKPTFSSIDYRFANTQVAIHNNLVYRISLRNGAQGTVSDNGPEPAPASLFVNAAGGDWHLAAGASAAIDKGKNLGTAAGLDLDGKPHTAGAGSDLGAYER
ncbi:MAG: hypothetical protein KC503_26445 [Myxococcales bacterium]|nr:hypothetical protein [Myxococcales bacterium]